MVNEDPVKALKAALTDELHIDLKTNPIHCRMEETSLLIEGLVGKVSEKKRTLLKAMELAGSSGVIDRLRVRPASRMSDGEIKKHMMDALDEEQTLSGYDIKVEVNDGVIDIEGEVWSLSHKRIAGVLAWWIPGSRDVINSIEVKPPEDDNDDEIVDALRLVLEKDRLVDATSIRPRASNWTVILDGVACSETERAAAEDDAWYIWGVNEVINNITIEKGTAHENP
ncbi:MAG: BON domain-containing protein [Deltaproteobacteria bacterium]|nr:BON domain-containing protein [Deltaproteobacteria bacterium]